MITIPHISMFSATDIANFLACQHTATLDRAESREEITKPFFNDPTVDLLRRLGLEHEQRYLRELAESHGLEITRINGNGSWEDACAGTIRALRNGSAAIYQAAFLNTLWRGRPDFLLRVDTPSALGTWSYEVVETKLARSTKAGALVQLCFYSDLLSRIQRVEPKRMHVVLGGGRVPSNSVSSATLPISARCATNSRWRGSRTETYPEPTEHCDVCGGIPFATHVAGTDDHLSLVAGISRNQRKALVGRGVSTVAGSRKARSFPQNPKSSALGTPLCCASASRLGFRRRVARRIVSSTS